jgi:hypothetical protein
MHNLHVRKPLGKCMLLESLNFPGKLLLIKRLYRYAAITHQQHNGDDVVDGDENLQSQLPRTTTWTTEFTSPSPGEVRFSTLDDYRVVDVRLPAEPVLPVLYACGYPDWTRPWNPPATGGEADLFSLYFKRCNGGTLASLMEMHADGRIGAPVPEPFA